MSTARKWRKQEIKSLWSWPISNVLAQDRKLWDQHIREYMALSLRLWSQADREARPQRGPQYVQAHKEKLGRQAYAS